MKQLLCVLMLITGIFVFCSCRGLNEVSQSPEVKNPDYKFEEIKIPKNFEVPKRTVLIDAGHGGFDSGAYCAGIREDKINLKIAQFLEQKLLEQNYKVYMTRTDDNALDSSKDGDMYMRQKIISKVNADITLSIHLNAMNDSSVSGAMVFYYPKSEKSKELAQILQDKLNALNRRAKKITAGDKFVLRVGKGAAALIECGFLTNYTDRTNLKQEWYQRKIADIITEAVNDYFETIERAEIPV